MDKARRTKFLDGKAVDDFDCYDLGVWLGYPPCCVINFGARVMAFNQGRFDDIPQNQKLDGSGFVPCPHCNVDQTEEQLVEAINRDRLCPTPFPQYELSGCCDPEEEAAEVAEWLERIEAHVKERHEQATPQSAVAAD